MTDLRLYNQEERYVVFSGDPVKDAAENLRAATGYPFRICKRIAEQRATRRLDGGGMQCPACGERCLVLLPEERAKGAPTRFRCGNDPACGVEVLMRLVRGSIVLEGGGVRTIDGEEQDVAF